MNNMLEDKFSVKEDVELYYKDVFIGYLLEPDYKDIFIDLLNYSKISLDSHFKHTVEDRYFKVGNIRWLEIKNRNFNTRILNKLNLIPDYGSNYSHYAIKANDSVYTNFLTSDFKEAVYRLIEEKSSYNSNFPIMSEDFKLTYKIQPLNLD